MKRAYLLAGNRGSILVEALIVLPVCVLALSAGAELSRRAVYEAALHHAAFLFVRGAVFESESMGRKSATRFWKRAVWAQRTPLMDPILYPTHLCAKLYWRFPALQVFRFGAHTKHSFEATRQCRFFFSQS